MKSNLDKIALELYKKIQTRFNDVKIANEYAEVLSKKEDIPQARFFEFEYTENSRPYGTVAMSLDEDDGLIIQISGNLTSNKSAASKFFDFIRSFRQFAKRRLMKFNIRNIGKRNLDQRDYTFQAKRKEYPPMQPIMENKLYGSNKISYQDLGEARLIIKHSQPINTDYAAGRSQHIQNIYIENIEGERFKYPFKHLNGARALAEHIKHGGNPYDSIGRHITGLSEELAHLRKFKNYVGRQDQISEAMGSVSDRVIERIENIKKQVNQLQRSTYYEEFAESFVEREERVIPEELVNDWVDRLTIRTFNEELKGVFPYLYELIDEGELPVKTLNPDDLLEDEQLLNEGGFSIHGILPKWKNIGPIEILSDNQNTSDNSLNLNDENIMYEMARPGETKTGTVSKEQQKAAFAALQAKQQQREEEKRKREEEKRKREEEKKNKLVRTQPSEPEDEISLVKPQKQKLLPKKGIIKNTNKEITIAGVVTSVDELENQFAKVNDIWLVENEGNIGYQYIRKYEIESKYISSFSSSPDDFTQDDAFTELSCLTKSLNQLMSSHGYKISMSWGNTTQPDIIKVHVYERMVERRFSTINILSLMNSMVSTPTLLQKYLGDLTSSDIQKKYGFLGIEDQQVRDQYKKITGDEMAPGEAIFKIELAPRVQMNVKIARDPRNPSSLSFVTATHVGYPLNNPYHPEWDIVLNSQGEWDYIIKVPMVRSNFRDEMPCLNSLKRREKFTAKQIATNRKTTVAQAQAKSNTNQTQASPTQVIENIEFMFESFMEALAQGNSGIFSQDPLVKREAIDKLNDLLSRELLAGPDGINARNSLRGIIDDPVFLESLRDMGNLDVRALIKEYIKQQDPDLIYELNFNEPSETAPETEMPEPEPMPTPAPAPTPPESELGGEMPGAELEAPEGELGGEMPGAEIPPGQIPPGQQPPTPMAERLEFGKRSSKSRARPGFTFRNHRRFGLKRILKKAQKAGATLETVLNIGDSDYTIEDIINECGFSFEECGFESPKSGIEEVLDSIMGFWNSEAGNFTKGGEGVKTIVIKKAKDGEFKHASDEDIKYVLNLIDKRDPSSNQHNQISRIKDLAGLGNDKPFLNKFVSDREQEIGEVINAMRESAVNDMKNIINKINTEN